MQDLGGEKSKHTTLHGQDQQVEGQIWSQLLSSDPSTLRKGAKLESLSMVRTNHPGKLAGGVISIWETMENNKTLKAETN